MYSEIKVSKGSSSADGGRRAGRSFRLQCQKTEQEVIHLKMAVADADNSAQAEGAREIAREVEKATDGMIQIEVLAGGTLGGERDTVELAMLGGIDIVTCANSVFTQWIPEMSIFRSALSLYQ